MRMRNIVENSFLLQNRSVDNTFLLWIIVSKYYSILFKTQSTNNRRKCSVSSLIGNTFEEGVKKEKYIWKATLSPLGMLYAVQFPLVRSH